MPDGETFSGRSIKQSAPGRSGDEKAATVTLTTTISLGGDHQNHQLLHDGFGARIGRGLREAGGASLGLHGGGVTGYRDQDTVSFFFVSKLATIEVYTLHGQPVVPWSDDLLGG
jgi:hypothetical protein